MRRQEMWEQSVVVLQAVAHDGLNLDEQGRDEVICIHGHMSSFLS
jgi:hypothetical protein